MDENVDYYKRNINVNNEDVDVFLYDTGGLERFKGMTVTYYRPASVVLCMFDITNEDSWDNLKTNWFSEAEKWTAGKALIIIVASKMDMSQERVVPEEDVRDYCDTKGISYLEVSSFTGENVEYAVQYACEQAVEFLAKRS